MFVLFFFRALLEVFFLFTLVTMSLCLSVSLSNTRFAFAPCFCFSLCVCVCCCGGFNGVFIALAFNTNDRHGTFLAVGTLAKSLQVYKLGSCMFDFY